MYNTIHNNIYFDAIGQKFNSDITIKELIKYHLWTKSTGTVHIPAKGRWRNDVIVAMMAMSAIVRGQCPALQRRAAQSVDSTFRNCQNSD